MWWLDDNSACHRLLYVVEDVPVSNESIKELKEAMGSDYGRMGVEISDEVKELFQRREEKHIATAVPLVSVEETISSTSIEEKLTLIEELDLLTIGSDDERDCVDGGACRIIIRTPQGQTSDVYWQGSERGEQCRMALFVAALEGELRTTCHEHRRSGMKHKKFKWIATKNNSSALYAESINAESRTVGGRCRSLMVMSVWLFER